MTFGDAGRDRLLASCGIAGPVLFTAAWVASSLLQTGHPAGAVQLSGLAAMDARDPQVMMAGFIGLGACSVAFGTALGRVRPAGSAGPWLVKAAGVATVAAGLFRRDHSRGCRGSGTGSPAPAVVAPNLGSYACQAGHFCR